MANKLFNSRNVSKIPGLEQLMKIFQVRQKTGSPDSLYEKQNGSPQVDPSAGMQTTGAPAGGMIGMADQSKYPAGAATGYGPDVSGQGARAGGGHMVLPPPMTDGPDQMSQAAVEPERFDIPWATGQMPAGQGTKGLHDPATMGQTPSPGGQIGDQSQGGGFIDNALDTTIKPMPTQAPGIKRQGLASSRQGGFNAPTE